MKNKTNKLGQDLILRDRTQKTPSLNNRVILTIALLLIVHSVNFIPIPYIDYKTFFDSIKDLDYKPNSSLGGNLNSVNLFSLGMLPYINASIITQLLIKFNPKLSQLREDGDYGRRKINNYLRYLTFLCAIFQSISQTYTLRNFFDSNIFVGSQISLCLITGSMILLWFSEILTKDGLGNGPSLLICFNIASSLPNQLQENLNLLKNTDNNINRAIILIAFFFIALSCVLIDEGVIDLPLLSARQMLVNYDEKKKFFFKTQNTLPLRINPGGVMPLIFTSSAMAIFYSLGQTLGPILSKFSLPLVIINLITSQNSIFYLILYGITILFFTKLYSKLILDPEEISEQLRKNSVIIKKINPGKSTTSYLKKTIDYLSKLNALAFFMIFFILNIVGESRSINITNFKGIGMNSQIILISVLLDSLRRFKGFYTVEKMTRKIKRLAKNETIE